MVMGVARTLWFSLCKLLVDVKNYSWLELPWEGRPDMTNSAH